MYFVVTECLNFSHPSLNHRQNKPASLHGLVKIQNFVNCGFIPYSCGYSYAKIMFWKDGVQNTVGIPNQAGKNSENYWQRCSTHSHLFVSTEQESIFKCRNSRLVLCTEVDLREMRKERCGCLQNSIKPNEISNETTGDRSTYTVWGLGSVSLFHSCMQHSKIRVTVWLQELLSHILKKFC